MAYNNAINLGITGVVTADGDGTFTASTGTNNKVIRWSTANDLQDTTINVSDAGEMTNTSQPAFFAYLAGAASNVTGNGSTYTLGDTDVGPSFTEVFDQNADFSTGSSAGAIFTAPVTGRYMFVCNLTAVQVNTSTTMNIITITSNAGSILTLQTGSNNMQSGAASLRQQGVNFVDMDASDTCYFTTSFEAGSKIVDINGGSSNTQLAGYLVC